MRNFLNIKIFFAVFMLSFGSCIYAQEKPEKDVKPPKEKKATDDPSGEKREVLRNYRENIGVTYDKSWAWTFKYRTDGWQIGADYNKTINYFKSRVISFDFGELKHVKQSRQSKDPAGGIFGFNGIRPFVYGKQNSFFVLHGNIGRRHLLAERARKNGVMIQFQYTGGLTVGILKGYQLDVLPVFDDGTPNPQGEPVPTGYDDEVNNGFTNYNRIIGYSGFGKGIGNLGIQPGINGNISFQFDWSSQDSFIKALEAGFHTDIFFWNVPIMIENNRFYFMSVYVGVLLGKKKN